MQLAFAPHWVFKMNVLASKLSELTGYSIDAIRGKRTCGVWLQDIHWFKAPDGHLTFNVDAIYRWMEGKTT